MGAKPPAVYPGDVFGRLTVIREAGRQGDGRAYLVRCICGQKKVVPGRNLRSGNTKSCGCYRRERGRTLTEQLTGTGPGPKHGHAAESSPTYRSWNAMLARCSNPNQIGFSRYGARGITVCDIWRGDRGFETFLAFMGERPEGLTLDRIDNDRGYAPANCRWATPTEQARNRRDSWITRRGA